LYQVWPESCAYGPERWRFGPETFGNGNILFLIFVFPAHKKEKGLSPLSQKPNP
jgi:hypothetical protein